jgi:hypothetical protein
MTVNDNVECRPGLGEAHDEAWAQLLRAAPALLWLSTGAGSLGRRSWAALPRALRVLSTDAAGCGARLRIGPAPTLWGWQVWG